MEGIHVIELIPHYTYSLGWSWLGFIFAILGLLLLIFMIIRLQKDTMYNIMIFPLVILMMLSSLHLFSRANKRFDHYTSQVRVDNSVSMNEFLSRYNIINHDGDLYEIEDIDKN